MYMHICIYVYLYIYIYIYINTYINPYIDVYIHTLMYMYIHIYDTHVYVNICVHVWIYIYTYQRALLHIHQSCHRLQDQTIQVPTRLLPKCQVAFAKTHPNKASFSKRDAAFLLKWQVSLQKNHTKVGIFFKKRCYYGQRASPSCSIPFFLPH